MVTSIMHPLIYNLNPQPKQISDSITSWLPKCYHRDVNPVIAGLGQLLQVNSSRKTVIEYANLVINLNMRRLILEIVRVYSRLEDKEK